MEAHYFAHDCFMQPDQLLANADRLAGIPGIIVQGRYDLLCPPITATCLCAAWPDAQLRLVETAGHSLGQPEIFAAVADAITDIARDDAFAARALSPRAQAAQ
jgi:proline iminopeptidase